MLKNIDMVDHMGIMKGVELFISRGDFYILTTFFESLRDGENVVKALKGVYDRMRGMIVLTDRRVMFIGSDIKTKRNAEAIAIEFEYIKRIKYRKGILFGTLIIDGHGKTVINSLRNSDAKGLCEYVNTRIEMH